jgi:putative membrane protein
MKADILRLDLRPAPRPFLRRYEAIATIGLLLVYAVGLAGHLLPALRGLMPALTPYVLLLGGLAAALPVFLEAGRGLWLWAAAVFALTFLLEAYGTATGRIFGPYTYGRTLGWRLLEVPVVIAFNWLLVILGFTQLVGRWLRSRAAACLLAALLASAFDLLLEPVAVRLDYWSWQAASIPLRNYLAWFLIALAAGLGFHLPGLSAPRTMAARYVLIQTAFFAGLRIAL